MNRQSAAGGGEQGRVPQTLEALGIASQHEVYIRKITLPPNARGQRAPCFGIYVRDMED